MSAAEAFQSPKRTEPDQAARVQVYGVKNPEYRLQRIRELPLDYMPCPEFGQEDADQSILHCPMPKGGDPIQRQLSSAKLPPLLASLYETPLLTKGQEQHLFRKYNYLKFKASLLREGLDGQRPKKRTMDEIEELYGEAVKTRNQIIQANLRLVVSIVKGFVGSHAPFDELISEGATSLMKAAEKFDYSRGYKFSTYATTAIRTNILHAGAREKRQHDRFRTGQHGALFEEKQNHRADPCAQEEAEKRRTAIVKEAMKVLSKRERVIIEDRYGFAEETEPKTLKEVGEGFGVTKERIRQIERRAQGKILLCLIEERAELD